MADYASQFDLWAYDDAKVIIERSTINTPVYTSWHFFDRSTLQMTHVVHGPVPMWTGFQHRARGTYVHVDRAFGTGAEGTAVHVHHAAQSFIGKRHHHPHTRGLVVTFHIPRSYSGLTARFDGLRARLYDDQTWTTGNSRLRLVDTVTLPWSPIVSGDNTLILTDSELAEMNNAYDTATVLIADSTLSQVRTFNRVRLTLDRSYVSGDIIASDDSIITMTGGGVGGRAVREPRAQFLVNGARTRSPGFTLGFATMTSRPGEVLSGGASIKSSQTDRRFRFSTIVRSNRTALALTPGRTYRATFAYRILTPPSDGLDLTFVSQAAFARGVFLPCPSRVRLAQPASGR